jgi:predicted nucleotide-binding protein (sugar kinase/HSP70/actin superfamily)
MRVINVIFIKDSIVDLIESFGIEEEQLSQDVVEKAEARFTELAKEISMSDEETSDAIENGYWHDPFNDGSSVCITWSDI